MSVLDKLIQNQKKKEKKVKSLERKLKIKKKSKGEKPIKRNNSFNPEAMHEKFPVVRTNLIQLQKFRFNTSKMARSKVIRALVDLYISFRDSYSEKQFLEEFEKGKLEIIKRKKKWDH